ncbi:hypothetical protein J2Z60_000670, partial [Lactobacillus colini]|nr:hypothetical protein [Lactobacillus colini]
AQHSTAQHSTAQHSTAQHSTAQHSTAQHSTAQHTDYLSKYLFVNSFKESLLIFKELVDSFCAYQGGVCVD